jgi:Phytanoyl-CoA dioxygenase (PhyH)
VALALSLIQKLAESYERDGFAIIRGLVPKAVLARINSTLLDEFGRAERSGELEAAGGMFSGHLNCFPGRQSRAVYQTLEDEGVLEFVRRVAPTATRAPNVGCNMNLTGSYAQNYHIDGYFQTAFPVVNVAPVDTTPLNGAMEVSPGTHLRDYKYWQFVVARRPSQRVALEQGDVLIRSSTVWHRGMPNHSRTNRPMLAFSWEDGGSQLSDPYDLHGGEVRFLPNRYTSGLAGKFRERAFAQLPRVASGYRFARSLVDG